MSGQNRSTILYLTGCAAAAAVAGLMLFDLPERRGASAAALAELERKENQAQTSRTPGAEELRSWAEAEQRFRSIWTPGRSNADFLQELIRIAGDDRLQPSIISEEKAIDPNQSRDPQELRLFSLGIREYQAMTISVKGDYPDVAKFLSRVSQPGRPLELRKVVLRRNPPSVDVTVTLHLYKKEGV